MYPWIWRHLPGGLPGKLVGSLVLVAAAVALLFFIVFPWVEPKLPFNDVTVTPAPGTSTSAPAATPSGTPSP